MDRNIIITIALFVLLTAGICRPALPKEDAKSKCQIQPEADPLDKILNQLKLSTEKLESYQANVEYLFKQPALFDSQQLRKGVLYYAKIGKGSRLRMNFQTLKQDDEKQQKHDEHFILDGIWLTQIDYQLKTATRYQTTDPNTLADPNKPIDAFELLSKNFPIVGFSKTEDLKEQFDITLLLQGQSEPSPFIQLNLKVKPDSVYKDDYTSMDFWIDRETHLPAKIIAISVEEDIYEIKLLKPKINKAITGKVFDFKIPKGFAVKEEPFRKNTKQDDKPKNR
jgi:outer membrane lipoprotein-sorting protein